MFHRTMGNASILSRRIASNLSGHRCRRQAYGPSAWWWEVEELVRKLLLSAVVVLVESGSPLQVCVSCDSEELLSWISTFVVPVLLPDV